MIGILSLTSLAGGTLAACIAERCPRSRDRTEVAGGLMLILGFVLVGVSLAPLYR